MRKKLETLLKRVFDIVFALSAIVVLSPILLTAAALIKASSPGPVLYRGVRAGRYGKPFEIWKFRSMVVDAERLGGTTTGKGDPRLTSVGRILRKFKMDELPQFVNVLQGHMSVVGPRPEVYEYTDQYSEVERRILNVRPGITDLASIEFSDLQEWVGANDVDRVYREKVLPRKNQLRLKYADEHSLWLDLRILARTISLVLWKPVAAFAFRSRPRVESHV